MRSSFRAASLTLTAFVSLAAAAGVPPLLTAAASAAPAPQRISGTWDLSWRNSRGEVRKGSMVVEQRGSQLTATVYDRGGATATGTIAGSAFTLEGRRLALPFTVTGRVQGRKMVGTLLAIGILERRFTGVRRGGR
jgi:hypothetical protein